MVRPLRLVEVLFERGKFGSDATAVTAAVVQIYGLGLPAFVLQKVYQPLFFARADTKSPFYYALVAMVINAALAIGLAPVIGYLAAAIGGTLASWGMVALLWVGSRKMGVSARLDRRFHKRIWRITVASILMGVALLAAQLALNPMFGAGAWRYLALALLVLIGDRKSVV